MGLILKVLDADFSDISVGKIYWLPRAELREGLTHLYETRADSETVNAVSGVDDAFLSGEPVLDSASAIVDPSNRIVFPYTNAAGGTHAVVFFVRLTGASGYPLGSANGSNGSSYFQNRMETSSIGKKITFDHSTGSGGELIRAYVDKPAEAGWEMYCVSLEPAVGVRLTHPRSGMSNLGESVGSLTLTSTKPYSATIDVTSVEEKVALVARWDRVLTDLEISAFYADVKARLSGRGIQI